MSNHSLHAESTIFRRLKLIRRKENEGADPAPTKMKKFDSRARETIENAPRRELPSDDFFRLRRVNASAMMR